MSLPLGLLPRKHLLELSHSLTITLSFLHGCPQRPDCQGCGGRGPGADVPQGALQPRGMLCRPTASQVTLLPHALPTQIRLSVHQNHKAFLRVSQAIPKMEAATSELRLCVQGAEAVAQALSKARALAMVSVGGGAGGGGGRGGGTGAVQGTRPGHGQRQRGTERGEKCAENERRDSMLPHSRGRGSDLRS